ncbi:phage tail protein [Achromobacter sp. MYb9]|uniref:phage tail assembly protein n=1 Tax=Achromobacter sp. MYb9 TaxID=1827284 RepID=UPI000CFB1B96|nr:phage tail assembly protein [Achromobacter sp. MYb9]PQZ68429.1 phage tail protein [Achromobacter sp. MYb9]
MKSQDQDQSLAIAAPAHPAAALDGNDGTTQSVTLESPIKRGGQDIHIITVRRPKAGALRGTSLVNLVQLDVASLQTVLPRVTDPMISAPEVANLEPADLLALGAAVASFFMTKAERAALQTA